MSNVKVVWKMKDAVDVVNSPAHYKHGGLETIDVIEALRI